MLRCSPGPCIQHLWKSLEATTFPTSLALCPWAWRQVSSWGESSHLKLLAWSQATRAFLALRQRSPRAETQSHAVSPLSFGLRPGFAVVIYFWHVSLPSSRSRNQKKTNKISDSGHKCLLGTRLQLSPVPSPSGALGPLGFLSSSFRGLQGPSGELPGQGWTKARLGGREVEGVWRIEDRDLQIHQMIFSALLKGR